MVKKPVTFLDLAILSQQDPKEDPIKMLRTISTFFSRAISLKERSFRDEVGHPHYCLELEDNKDLTTFIQFWTVHFEFLLHTIPKYIKELPPTKITGHSRSPYIVLKLVTNSGALSHLFLNLTNVVLPLLKVSFYFEEVLDGIVIFIKEEKDFRTFLEDPLDEAFAKQFYNTLGITDEKFFVERRKFLPSRIGSFPIKKT